MTAGDPEAAPPPRPPRHRLHPLTLTATSWRTARMEPARVIVPALVIFGLDAIQGTFYTEIAVDHLGIGSIIGAVLFGASTLGLTFYAGMLERLVGSVERNEPAQPVFVGAADPALAAPAGGRGDPGRDRRRGLAGARRSRV